MSTVFACLFLLCSSVVILANEKSGCPFKSSEKSKPKIRGHKEPFGYQAKQWKRIETLYEHPHPEVFYEKYMRASKPVIIRGGAKNWPAINKWTNLTYLNHQTRFGRPDINWKKMYSYDPYHPVRVRMTMKEFTNEFDEHNLYMDATLPTEIANDVHWPKSMACPFYQKRTKQLAIMFNNGKSSSDLHMDATCTYFVQVTGSRRWLLTNPKEVKNVYSGDPNLIDHLGISIVDQNHVDLEKHQNVKDLTIYGAIMDPGDIIYVPEGWHHQVKTYNSPNIGVVFFMNYLMCEFHSNPEDIDLHHVKKCVFKIREQRPKTLKCKPFAEDDIPIPDVLRKYPPPNPGTITQAMRRPLLNFGVPERVMKDGNRILPMGISFVGQSKKSKEARKALNLAVVEGFRMFCTSTSDNSSQVLRLLSKKTKRKIEDIFDIVAFMPSSDHGKDKAKKAIDRLLKSLKTTKVHALLLQSDYCLSVNDTEPCDRDNLSEKLVETWRVMEDAHREGKIDTLGVSDFSLRELKKLDEISKIPVSIARARLDPFFRNKEFREYCKKNSIIFMGRSILGKRWKIESPNFPKNRDITKQYHILRASFQYKTSVHAVTYDWALRKGAVLCPPMDKELHVRVTAQGFRTESKINPDNLQTMDEHTDEKFEDEGLFSPGMRNYLPTEDKKNSNQEVVAAGEEKLINNDDLGDSFAQQYNEMTKTEKDFSNEVYTDTADYELFPNFMNIENPFVSKNG